MEQHVSNVIQKCNAQECQEITGLTRPSAVSVFPVPPFVHDNGGTVPINCVKEQTPRVHSEAVRAIPLLLYKLVQQNPAERRRWPKVSWDRVADVHRLMVALTAAFESSPGIVHTVKRALPRGCF